ncbi:diguanylate cyclase [Desulfovibrio sulfodismutans]|uniref:diguanylate cyclase n=1 Tax=Desulfolutivibrio sulfodismutans TaxID=63561 RepID=A0A7K3NMU7_9BACT|nr:GGDEF domain-containing protein [Desulfolutivibrio sulfodismutans]NDY57514.1 diguanylate cyclase [Desulfolutivibrio sulfodismutans]QLA11953.1 diguanylate cyclase [Desulfolutivibrio sulfodismutans DSM 3696]
MNVLPHTTGDGWESGREMLAAAQVVRYLAGIVRDPLSPPEFPPQLEAVEGLRELASSLVEVSAFAVRLAEGDLSGTLPVRGAFAGALKMLQGNLRHLAWQASRVAEGDFSQQVDFMGEFSQTFNAMVAKLDQSQAALRASESKYRQLAITDSLTGLYNLRYFFTIAEKEFRRALRHRRPVSIIMLDIDNFKSINDRHGHAVGDTVLREFSRNLGRTLRGADVLARYGGEEFIVLLPETGREAGAAVAEKLQKNVEGCFIGLESGCLNITASFGVSSFATFSGNRLTAAEIMEQTVKRADQALYRSKNSGKNMVTFLAFGDASAEGLGVGASRKMRNSAE